MLPKIGEKNYILWQSSWQNCGGELRKKKINRNFGNKVAKNWRKKIYYGNQVVKIVGEERKIIRNFGMPKMEGGKKELWQ